MQRSGRGRGAQALAAATAAKDAAANAFYEMDQAQRYVAGRVMIFADLDRDGARRTQAEFAALTETADTAASAYIAIVDAHDLNDPNRTPAEYDAAERAFGAVIGRLVEATARFNECAERITPQLARLEASLDRLAAALTAARETVAAAEAAIAAARTAGMDPSGPERDLAPVREALAQVGSQGLGGLGLAGALEVAGRARETAERVRDAALELPQLAGNVQRSLVAIRTRVDVVAGRQGPVEAAMSQLRRRYSTACWQDLKDVPATLQAAVGRARERLAEAEAYSGRREWQAAQQAVTSARTELTAADRRAGQVTGRLADLDAAAADPAKPAATVRFAVRDAQRLATVQPGGPAPGHVRVLDTLVARLDAAAGKLTGPHPDYWAYLTELEAIKTAAADVVARIRAERAGG
ncbi:molecular chaperone DnaJ [Actinomadura scrupuli]|uniref:molecular chaperone DnaJ n=1 Tax=Actinomadura scrupuli TaxID=559629 RepID=UPI003D95A3A0